MNCEHKVSKRESATTEYFGLPFEAMVDVCQNCGARLWTKDTHERFNEWLNDLKKKDRNKFILQFTLTENTKKCFDELLLRFPAVNEAVLIRAMTSVFLTFLARVEEFNAVSEAAAQSLVYHTLSAGTGRGVGMKAQFSPAGLLDIHSWGEILDLKPSKIVEEAVMRILTLNVESDPRLKEFWEKNILPGLELIIKSAS